jgi:hypothetical protein
MLLVVAV